MRSDDSLINLLPQWWREKLGDLGDLEAIDRRIGRENLNPERSRIFSALSIPPEAVKVVVLGQDPYPNPLHANGLAFSIPGGVVALPPTLKNIFKEYSTDLGYQPPMSGDLSPWVREGVLLLNSTLTCLPGKSLSHSGLGWEAFTQRIISACPHPKVVGILWGRSAQKFEKLFDQDMVIRSAHPSPLSSYRGFFGSRPFSRANQMLVQAHITPVNWHLQSA